MHTTSNPALDLDFGIAARPDVLAVTVSAAVDDAGPTRSIAALRDVAELLLARLAAAHPRAELAARRLQFGHPTGVKTAKVQQTSVRLDGVVYVPLEDQLDLWRRAELTARVAETLTAVAAEVDRLRPSVQLRWGEPTPRLLDPEPQRPRLVERWNSHVRALLEGISGATLSATWDAPCEVTQTPVSLEEVRLTLAPRVR